MPRIIELESAIERLRNAVDSEKQIKRISKLKYRKSEDSDTQKDVGRMIFNEIFGKLDDILAGLADEISLLADMALKIPDIAPTETKILSAIDDLQPVISDNSGEFSSIRDEIKKLASFVLENQPAEQPSVEVDLSDITRKLEMILSKPTPQQKIIEKLVEKKSEKKEWEFMVRRDQNGLIQKIEAIEV